MKTMLLPHADEVEVVEVLDLNPADFNTKRPVMDPVVVRELGSERPFIVPSSSLYTDAVAASLRSDELRRIAEAA